MEQTVWKEQFSKLTLHTCLCSVNFLFLYPSIYAEYYVLSVSFLSSTYRAHNTTYYTRFSANRRHSALTSKKTTSKKQQTYDLAQKYWKKQKRHLGTDSQQKHYSLLPPAVTLTWAIIYLRVSTLSPVVDSRPTLMATVTGEIWNPGKSGMSSKEEDNLVLMTLS